MLTAIAALMGLSHLGLFAAAAAAAPGSMLQSMLFILATSSGGASFGAVWPHFVVRRPHRRRPCLQTHAAMRSPPLACVAHTSHCPRTTNTSSTRQHARSTRASTRQHAPARASTRAARASTRAARASMRPPRSHQLPISASLSTRSGTNVLSICSGTLAYGPLPPQVLGSEIFGSEHLAKNYMFYDGSCGALGAMVFANLLPSAVYSWSAVGNDCYGAVCFGPTHGIIVVLCTFGCALGLAVAQRSAKLYAMINGSRKEMV